MTDKQKSEVLATAAALETLDMGGVADLVRRQYAELETLRAGYDAARLEIESLKAQQPGAAYAALPKPVYQWTDGTRTLHQDVVSAIRDYAGSKPEEGESWESWFEAAFDLLGVRVGEIFDEHALRASHGQAPAQAAPAVVAGPNLHAQIMNMPFKQPTMLIEQNPEKAYALGFRDARHVAAELVSAAPTTQPAPQQEASAMPSGWVSCTIEFDGSGPEEVAYGPKIMMDRLAKWLGKHFERTIAEKAAPQPSPASQDAARLDWLENDVECRVVHLGKSWYTRANFGMPYRKQASLREAIDAARAAQEGK